MKKVSAESMIKTYRTLVDQRGGTPIGERIFKAETGLSPYYWKGGFWRSWSAFQQAAGFSPNDPTQKIPDDMVLFRFAQFALERGDVPTEADVNLKRKDDSSFPSKSVFRRWGSREALLHAVADYCDDKPEFAPVLALLKNGISNRVDQKLDALRVSGFVYLLRSGKNYKIGRTNATGRRLRELAIQLPERPDTVHVIETDDPEGIENYWHRRFADKRQGGEWFVLSADDVRVFKRRRFQ
jgi:hypothetical protein